MTGVSRHAMQRWGSRGDKWDEGEYKGMRGVGEDEGYKGKGGGSVDIQRTVERQGEQEWSGDGKTCGSILRRDVGVAQPTHPVSVVFGLFWKICW